MRKKFLLMIFVLSLFTSMGGGWLHAQTKNGVSSTSTETIFEDDFNDGNLDGWRLIDGNNDNKNWKLDTGEGWVISKSYQIATYPQDYIVTESKYTLSESSVLSLRIGPAHESYNDNTYKVVISEDISKNISEWDIVLEENFRNPNNIQEIVEKTIDLSDDKNRTVYIGVYHSYGEEFDGTGVILDYIKLTGAAPAAEPVAKIGETPYNSLAEAVAEATAGQTITLIADVELAETATIPAGKTIIIDLNGKKITSGYQSGSTSKHIYPIDNYGNLTIEDKTGTGSITGRGIFVQNGSKLTVESGSIYGIDSNGGSALYQYGGDIVIKGGHIEQKAEGTYNFAINALGGTVTVNNGKIAGNHGAIAAGGAAVVINGGELVCTGTAGMTDNVLYTSGDGSITINGGTFVADKDIPSGGCCVYDANGKVTINGGTFGNSSGGDVWGTTGTTIKGGTFENLTEKQHIAAGYELGADGTVAAKSVAEVNGVKYTSFAEAAAAATAGSEIKLLANIEGDITVPANVTLNGNGFAISGGILAEGDITFAGVTTAADFDANVANTAVNIPAGASLQLTGSARLVIGHGATFNIEGNITDAKTADKATLVPSLKIAAGASITGNGVTFNVNNAYIVANANTTSKNSSANGTLDFNINNSIWEQTGVLAFYVPTSGKDPVVNFELKNSVLTTTSHLVFSVTKGEIVIDNSLVNQGTSRQIENRSTMTIKNGSVVNGAVATSSNAINPGTIIVDNATYAVTGEFSGAAEGTGTIIINKGANVSVGSIKAGANVTVDAEGMAAGDEINFTANLSQFTGTLSVINNDKLEAQIVNGKIVLAAKPVAKIGDTPYTTLDAAFAAATEGQTITLLADATPVLTSQRAITKAAVIDLGGKTLTLKEDDLYFGTTTFKNGTIVVDPSVNVSTAVFWMFANQTLTFDNVKVVATGVTGTYLIGLDGNNSDLNLLNGSEILVENTTALDLDIICVNASTGNDIKVENSKVNVTNLDGRVFFRGNYTVIDSEVNLAGITKAGFRIEAGQTLSIEGTSEINIAGELRDGGIHLTDLTATYTKAETAIVNATINEVTPAAKIGDAKYASLQAAIDAVQNGETIVLTKDCAEVVSINKSNVAFTINGKISDTENIAYTGKIQINVGQNVTVRNINFSHAGDEAHDFIANVGSPTGKNYNTTLLVEGCSFVGGNNNYNTVAVRTIHPTHTQIKNSTGTGLHSFLQNTGGQQVTVEGVVLTDSKGGLAIGSPNGAVSVKGCDLTTNTYGVRLDANNTNAPGTTLKNNKVNAYIPVSVRKATAANYVVTVEGDRNNYAATNSDGVWFAACTTEYEDGVALNEPTGKVKVILNDANLNAAGVYGDYVPVAKIGDVEYTSLEAAFKAATSGCTIEILSDVTVDYNWDARNTGGKFTVPVTINGNGKTIKFTASVNDNNYQAPFRFEADATVKGLTIDMSAATDNRFRAISSKGNLTVDNCNFIGKDESLNCRAIIFGEGAGANVGNLAISITNSEFKNWKRGITDNENGQDVKTATITGNTLENAAVYVSAYENVTFTGNTVEGAYVDIRSYTANSSLNVTATGNTLEENTDTAYNYIKATGNIDQEGFKVYAVAKIGDVEYTTIEKAYAALQEGDEIVILKKGSYALKVKNNITITGAVDGVEFANIGAFGCNGANVTFNNVTFTYAENSTYKGLQHSGNLVYNNCTFNGQVFLYGQSETFNNCTFNTTDSNNYNVWTYGAKEVAFNECTFNCAGKSVLIYNESASVNNNVAVTKSQFNALQAVEGKAAIEMDSSLQGTINLTIEETTATGFAAGNVSGNSLWNNKKANNDITVVVDNETVLAPINGDGTEDNPYLINNVRELVAFRESVNAGKTEFNAPGVYVALNADIDMTGINNWVGIGSATAEHGFMGNFDGKNFKIKNLTITNPALDSDGYAYAGLFAVTEGTDKDNQNTIKNLTIENVTINTTGHIAAAAIAYPYYTIVDNVKVCGDIAIKGGDYTSGVLAYTRRCVNASNLSIVGNEGSYVEGNQVVGGVISDIQMNGGLTADYKNFSAEGIAVTGIKNVGGISGIIATQTLDGASVKKVTLSGNAGVGIVSGALGGTSTISSVTYENVTGATDLLGATYDGNAIEARIGDTYYATLKNALAAQGEATVELLAPVTIANGETVVFNLNKKTVVATDNATGSYAMITNKGDLTIEGEGALKLTATNNRGWNAYSSVISNTVGGKLTVNGGTIEHLGGTDMAYGIDNLTNGKGTYAETVVNGGTVKSTYRAIRQFLNGVEAQNILTVNGGTIEGVNKSIWMQDPSKNANTGSLTVGENATLNGNVYLFVTAGSTEWPVEVSIASAALRDGSEVMTGNVPSGYEVALVGGNYGVFKGVAKIGTSYYASLQAAVNAVQNGETVTLIKDVAENVTLTEQTGLYYTIDGAGKTMNGTITVKALSDTNDNRRITIKDIKFVDTVNGRDFITSTETNHYPRLTVEGCSFTGTGKEAANTVAIRLKSSHSVVISNCTGTGLHSFLQNKSGWNLTIENVIVTESKSGLALGTVQGVTVKGSNIDVAGYGIRLDANTYNNNAVIESNIVKAFIPVVVREANTNSNITFNGTNDMTETNTDGYWCVIGTSEYEENGQLPTDATGNVVVNLNTNLSYEGVYGNYAVAQIGEVKYATLQAAIDAVQEGETITVVREIALTEGLTVAAGKVVTLDLNGNTVTGTPEVAAAFAVITNMGDLTITNGTIICDHKLAGSTSYAVNTIVNSGKLTIDGATIENKSTASNQIGYAIDNNSTSYNSIVVIEAGEVTASGSNYYDGIRMFCNNTTAENNVIIEGGEVSSLWMQNPSDGAAGRNTKDVKGSFEIKGGSLNALYLEPSKAFAGSISAGYVGSVSAFETADGRDLKAFIKGGTFGEDVTNYIAPGYSCKQNAEGKYVVKFANVEIFYTAAGVETTKEQAAYSLSFAITDYDNKEASVMIGSKKPTTQDRIKIVTPATVAFEGVEYNVTSLANKAFDGVRGIKEIIISEGVKSLGSRALANMYELVDVVFPSSLKSVGDQCFTGYGDNHKIKTITCLAATPPTASGNWQTASFQMWVAENVILFVAGDANVYKKTAGWSRFTNILGINSEIEIPGNYNLYTMKVNVTSVSPRAASIKIGRRFPQGVPAILDTIPETASFYGIEFPITSIPEKGFQGVKFEKIVIPGNIKNIGNTAFGGSNLADTLIIEEGVETLGDFAFQGCYSLSEIILPSTLKSVGEKCFNNVGVASANYDAVEVSLVYTGVTPPTVGANTGANIFSNNIQGTLYVPTLEVVDSFKAAAGWNISSIKPFEAKIDDTVYYSLAKAINASKADDFITLIADVETAKADTIPEGVTLDINTHNITANIYGTVKTAGGVWTTVAVPGFNSRDMLGEGAIYNTTDATVVNLANEVKVLAGSIVLNPHPETEWWTLPGQSLSIATGATFEIPAGVKFTVREGNANVNGTLINNGTLAINAGATVTGNLTGDIHFLGGNFITADGYKMVGTTSEYYYNATNALVNIESTFGDITILSGAMTLGQSWRTVQGQTLTVAEGASFTVPTGMTFEVFANTHVVVEGTLVTGGTVYLQAGATVKAEAGLNIQTTVAGHVVDYNNGVYSVVEQTIFTQTIQLNAGWNWFSSYVETDLESLQAALGTSGVKIKDDNLYTDYYAEYDEWYGSLNSYSYNKMYMIKATEDIEISISGNLINTNDIVITLVPGWNWISYPNSESVDINIALQNLDSQEGDKIKSDSPYADYYEGYGWYGSLNTLEPGVGYMYYNSSNLTKTFTYSTSTRRSEAKANVTTEGNYWTPNAAQFANNMTMTAVLDVENINYEVAAFVNGECRGSARPIYVEALDAYMLFLTIHGEEVEEMTFKYYDIDTDIEYTLSDRINYSNNAILGSLKEPYMFTRGTTGIGKAELSQLNIYPNPTTTAAEINLNATFDKVEVFNALGVKVAEYSNVDSIDALETAGIYVIRATNNSVISHCRLVVK